MNSLIIPVYKNAENIPFLIEALVSLNSQINHLEIVFVVDGSPDNSAELLQQLIPIHGLKAQLILLSRNFGSYAAIRQGLKLAQGERFAVMAADLQEPPELAITFFNSLEQEAIDIVIATREARNDPLFSKITSVLFWRLYKYFVIPEVPIGGVDVFACNKVFRDYLLAFDESHSSLIALLFWMGFKRKIISYTRLARQHGESAWSFKKKYIYFKDSIFSFSDLPIRLVTWFGSLGILFSIIMGLIVFFAKLYGSIDIPGYSATVLTIMFFGALNLFGIGIIGTYTWRTYENTKQRPSALIMSQQYFNSDHTQDKT